MSFNEIEGDSNVSWGRQASRASSHATKRIQKQKKPIKKRVTKGIAKFFGYVDKDPNESPSWHNRRIRHAMNNGKISTDLSRYGTQDSVFIDSSRGTQLIDPLHKKTTRASQVHGDSVDSSRFVRESSKTSKPYSTSSRQPRGRKKDSVFKLALKGFRSLTTPVKKSQRKPHMHSRSFTRASLSTYFDENGNPMISPVSSNLPSTANDILDDFYFDVATPTSPLVIPSFSSQKLVSPLPAIRESGDRPDFAAAKRVVPKEQKPTKAGWQFGRSQPKDQPDTPYDNIDGFEFKKIKHTFLNEALNTNKERKPGVGLVGKWLNREYKEGYKNDADVSKQIDEMDVYRPYFTYWVCAVQILVFIVAASVYGIAPIGFTEKEVQDEVLTVSLAYHQVSYMEKENFWIGPRTADLIHLGAKYSPCMRKDKNIENSISIDVDKERGSACCIRNDGSGCVQTTDSECSNILSVWYKWTKNEPGPKNRTSGSVCGQDPELCQDPASTGAFEWEDDITKWPICKKTDNVSLTDGQRKHMSCELVGRPCCIGVQGKCVITTREYCNFKRGYFHEEATLCSQISCMNEICGMIDFWNPQKPDQFYRLWTSLFLHAGVVQLIISLVIQMTIMRDLEKLAGWIRIGIIYIGCGIAGSLCSAIFLPYHVEAGPSGSQFGLLACLIVEVIQSWKILAKPLLQLAKLSGIVLILFIIGLLPMVDNFAHIAGFVFGCMLAFALLPTLTFGKFDKRRKLITVIIGLLGSIGLFVLLIILFYVTPVYECKYCHYFNCIPFTENFCKNQILGNESIITIV